MSLLPLTDLAAVKLHLSVSGTTQDTQLTNLFNRYSADIAQFLNRRDAMTEESHVEIVDVEAEQRRFRVRASPIVSVSEFVFEPTQDFASGSIIDSEIFVIRARHGLIELLFDLVPAYGPIQPQSARITYIGGFAVDLTALRASEFAHLEQACLLQMQATWKRQKSTPQRVQITGKGGSTTIAALDLVPEVKRMLMPLRRRSVG